MCLCSYILFNKGVANIFLVVMMSFSSNVSVAFFMFVLRLADVQSAYIRSLIDRLPLGKSIGEILIALMKEAMFTGALLVFQGILSTMYYSVLMTR